MGCPRVAQRDAAPSQEACCDLRYAGITAMSTSGAPGRDEGKAATSRRPDRDGRRHSWSRPLAGSRMRYRGAPEAVHRPGHPQTSAEKRALLADALLAPIAYAVGKVACSRAHCGDEKPVAHSPTELSRFQLALQDVLRQRPPATCRGEACFLNRGSASHSGMSMPVIGVERSCRRSSSRDQTRDPPASPAC